MKKTNDPIELTDEEVGNVNGGMKIVLFDKPKFLNTILRLIFKIEKKPSDNNDANTAINGQVIANTDNDINIE